MKAIKAKAFYVMGNQLKIVPIEKKCTSFDLSKVDVSYYVRKLIIRDETGSIILNECRALNFVDKLIIFSHHGVCFLEGDDEGKLIVEEGKGGIKKIFVLLNYQTTQN